MDTRLITDEPARGSWNMAVDEALLQSAEQHRAVGLRFYQWIEPTLSLGYFQRFEARHGHSSSANLPVVRRSTGGGAIVHHRELTYSFVTPIHNRFSSSPQGFVKQFHESLIATLANWGIRANMFGDASHETGPEPFLCFQRRASLDVLVRDSKVVGSAQRRHHGALLQHGTILLARSPHAESLPGLSELTQVPIDPVDLAMEWSHRLSRDLGFRLMDSTLTPAELSLARNIERDRFADPRWTRKR